MNEKPNILIVDDSEAILFLLEKILNQCGVNILKTTSGHEALELVQKYDFALILMDIQMPGLDGFETAELMRKNKKAKYIPILFMTATQKNQKYVFKGYEIGAVDFMFKPLEPEILKSKVDVFLQLYKQKKKIEKANEELKQAKQKAETANNAKSSFLANMSHEIRTPLNAILGYSEILEDIISDNQQKKYLTSIRSAGKSLLALINDILDLSRVEAGKLKLEYIDMNLNNFMDEIKHIFFPQVKNKGLDLIFQIDDNLPEAVICEETRLRQVLINLVNNAVKFTEKGYIKVTCSGNYSDKKSDKMDLIIAVEDTGIGIPHDQLENIFKAFVQQEGQSYSKYGGTGLGLAIVKRLVEIMKGKIMVDSEMGKGTTFKIIFKNLKISKSPLDQKESQNLYYISFDQPGTILIVDDIMFNREVLKGYLSNYGFSFIEAGNGKEAVHLAQSQKPSIILMDVKMPEMDGYEAAKIIKNTPELSQIKIIIISASELKQQDERKLKGFGDSYLLKPISKADLVSELMKFHPYSINKNLDGEKLQKPAVETEMENLSSENISRLRKLKDQLETECLPQWEKIHNHLFLDEIEEWAKFTKKIGEKYEYTPLLSWCQQLFSHLDSFDMEKLPAVLNTFPKVLNAIDENLRPRVN